MEKLKTTAEFAGVVQETSDSLDQGGNHREEKQWMDWVYTLISITE